jgi:hypothetical protein
LGRAQLVSAEAATAAVQSLADRARTSWKPWADRAKIDAELVRTVLGCYVAEHVASLPPLKLRREKRRIPVFILMRAIVNADDGTGG